MSELKYCKKCRTQKQLNRFGDSKKTLSGLDNWCLLCRARAEERKIIKKEKWHKENKAKISERNKEYNKKYPWIRRYHGAVQRCKSKKTYLEKNIQCHLTIDDVKKLWFHFGADKMTAPELHRINNEDDYTLYNCIFIEKTDHDLYHYYMQAMAKQDKINKILEFIEKTRIKK